MYCWSEHLRSSMLCWTRIFSCTYPAFTCIPRLTAKPHHGIVSHVYLQVQIRTCFSSVQGTSMAAPHVAGVAALAISAAGRRLPPAQVLAILKSSAQQIACPSTNPYAPGGPAKMNGPDAGIPTGAHIARSSYVNSEGSVFSNPPIVVTAHFSCKHKLNYAVLSNHGMFLGAQSL